MSEAAEAGVVLPASGVVSSQRHQNLTGIAWMLAAVASLSMMDATMKSLAPHYPPFEVAALRGMSALPVVTVWVGLAGGFRQLFTRRWRMQIARGALSVLMLSAFIFAVRSLPLADAYSIFFVAPLLITALSVPLLGERVDGRRWAAIGVGLLGVFVVLRPTTAGALTLAGAAMLTSAVCYALSAISVRALGRTDSTLSMMFWFTAMVALGAGALAAPHWVAPAREHWPALGLLAVFGAVGQYCITEAFRRGEASVIAPFEYTALGWGLLLDWALWSTRPNARMLLGAAIVIAAGIYLVRRERVHPEAEHP